MRLGRTTLLHFTSQVGVSVAGFAATFAIARLGGADVLGLYAVAVAVTFWLSIPSTAIGDAITKRLSEGGDHAELVTTGIAIQVVIGAATGLAVLVGVPQIEALVGARVGELIALLVVANVALVTTISVLNGEKKVAQSGGLKMLERSLRAVIHISAVLLGFGVTALVAGHLIAAVVAVLVGGYLIGVRPGRPSLETGRSLVKYARYSWLGKLKTSAFGWMDTIILAGFAVGATLIGVYEVAWNLASVFVLVAISVKSTLFPELSELSVGKNYDRIHHYLNEGLVFTGVFVIPGLFGAGVLGERVLRIYAPEFTRGTTVLVVLIIARLLAAYGEQLLNVVNAIDRPDMAFRINLVFVIANLVLNVVLVFTFGWVGAAAATTLSAVVVLILSYLALSRLIGRPDLPVAEVGRQVFAATVMAVAVMGVEPVAPENHFATVGLVLIGVIIYTATLVAVSTRVRIKARGLVEQAY
jgi:O-antigen/teichoic acid export membrane protein